MDVALCGSTLASGLGSLLERYGMELEKVADDTPIPGSHFGAPEAGLIANHLLVRDDTPYPFSPA